MMTQQYNALRLKMLWSTTSIPYMCGEGLTSGMQQTGNSCFILKNEGQQRTVFLLLNKFQFM